MPVNIQTSARLVHYAQYCCTPTWGHEHPPESLMHGEFFLLTLYAVCPIVSTAFS